MENQRVNNERRSVSLFLDKFGTFERDSESFRKFLIAILNKYFPAEPVAAVLVKMVCVTSLKIATPFRLGSKLPLTILSNFIITQLYLKYTKTIVVVKSGNCKQT